MVSIETILNIRNLQLAYTGLIQMQLTHIGEVRGVHGVNTK